MLPAVAVQVFLSVAYGVSPYRARQVLERVARDLPGVENSVVSV